MKSKTQKNHPQSQNYLKYAGIVVFIILFLIIYFRKTILNSFLSGQTKSPYNLSLMLNTAHAQEDLEQKKNF